MPSRLTTGRDDWADGIDACGRALHADVMAGLKEASVRARALDLCADPPTGQLLRPTVAYATAMAIGVPVDDRFWNAALAIQLAHEASLLHDDIIDGATERRGDATTVAKEGVARALVQGDHVLTTAYRLAALTGSGEFMTVFTAAVERTVAGERRQAAYRGRSVDFATYCEIVEGKSGELFGCAMACAALLAGGTADDWQMLGKRVGRLYQMVDDLLDYCPGAESGKAPFRDLRNGVWTWPLAHMDVSLNAEAREAQRRMFPSAMLPVLGQLEAEAAELSAELQTRLGSGSMVERLVEQWTLRAALAVMHESALAEVLDRAGPAEGALDEPAARLVYFGNHGRTFRFAANLFPHHMRERIAGIYAFCRLTDELVDSADNGSPPDRHAALNAWEETARRAYQGEETRIRLLDDVMGDMARSGVSFEYVRELMAGARMDLERARYETVSELETYTYRVASVVGLWLTEICGIRDGQVRERAVAMGHAMQLTNIVRDVGEDLDRGRIYVPAELMHSHAVTPGALAAMHAGELPLTLGYRRLLNALMDIADWHYDFAFPGLAALPPFMRRPVAVAARAYQGIHDEIRRNGYNNFQRRAHTSPMKKIWLGAGALVELARLPRPTLPEPSPLFILE